MHIIHFGKNLDQLADVRHNNVAFINVALFLDTVDFIEFSEIPEEIDVIILLSNKQEQEFKQKKWPKPVFGLNIDNSLNKIPDANSFKRLKVELEKHNSKISFIDFVTMDEVNLSRTDLPPSYVSSDICEKLGKLGEAVFSLPVNVECGVSTNLELSSTQAKLTLDVYWQRAFLHYIEKIYNINFEDINDLAGCEERIYKFVVNSYNNFKPYQNEDARKFESRKDQNDSYSRELVHLFVMARGFNNKHYQKVFRSYYEILYLQMMEECGKHFEAIGDYFYAIECYECAVTERFTTLNSKIFHLYMAIEEQGIELEEAHLLRKLDAMFKMDSYQPVIDHTFASLCGDKFKSDSPYESIGYNPRGMLNISKIIKSKNEKINELRQELADKGKSKRARFDGYASA